MEVRINDSTGEIEIVKIQNIPFNSRNKYILDQELFKKIKKYKLKLEAIESTELYFVNLSLDQVENDQSFFMHGSTDNDKEDSVIVFLISTVFWDNDEKTNSITLRERK
jgi:hypothetical protein